MSADSESVEKTEADNVNVGIIATVVVVGAFLMIAICAALTALVRAETAEYGYEKGAFANFGPIRKLKEEEQQKLSAPPAWVDRAQGVVSMPLVGAMELVTQELQRDPRSATPAIAVDEPDAGADAGVEAGPGEAAEESSPPAAAVPREGAAAQPAEAEGSSGGGAVELDRPAPPAETETPQGGATGGGAAEPATGATLPASQTTTVAAEQQ